MGLYLGSRPSKINMKNGKYKVEYYEPITYLTFSSPETFSISVSSPGWDGTLYYSTNKKNWTEWDGSEISGIKLYLRGSGNTKITGGTAGKWTLSGSDISCIGNIENLLDYETVKSGEHPTMPDYCYSGMFKGCTALTQAPALPATTLANFCYSNMFSGCTALTQAPELPATTLANYCYRCMFEGCTALTQAPELPATTLVTNCYAEMFKGCTNLTQAPELPATTLATYCYWFMFSNCTNLTQPPNSRRQQWLAAVTPTCSTAVPVSNSPKRKRANILSPIVSQPLELARPQLMH